MSFSDFRKKNMCSCYLSATLLWRNVSYGFLKEFCFGEMITIKDIHGFCPRRPLKLLAMNVKCFSAKIPREKKGTQSSTAT